MANCRHCGKQIEFLTTANGKSIPINADSMSMGDKIYERGKHKVHFAECKGAQEFRKAKPKAGGVYGN